MPTNKIPGFRERLEKLLPSLYEHRCSEGVPGGFFQRVEEGTWMGHVIEHIALEIQTLAGMDTGFGRTRTPEGEREGVYYVCSVIWKKMPVCMRQKHLSELRRHLIDGTDYNLEEDIQQLREIREDTRLGLLPVVLWMKLQKEVFLIYV